ncbi:DnaJ domain-containing protein [Paracoccus sp. Z330]|uniref:DnaJ domain-containing protein n=1 Tax=Paracoccus onchidii TaxID=3017813 RepID=A0ABT4ZAS4_9RHOB|nr:DnaJ C-terminal domain-containing protein [Paracoccus onchidii]MDB6176466.1 DnaJ domain-containing protein [Paracoccus onchidii]
MAADPYAALGLTKSATDAEIKKAYRTIAKEAHPDLNPDPVAAERFKTASAAYDLLKDPDQRRRFDAGEIDGQGQENPQRRYYREHAEASGHPYSQGYGFEGDPDLSDVFADLFGRRGRGFGAHPGAQDMRGQDYRFNLEIDFITAAKGGKARVSLPEGGDLEVAIPEGVRDGQTIRLRGKGGRGMGRGGAGDAYLTIAIAPHAQFNRDGNDVSVTLAIAMDEAVLGAKVPVPTIDGPVNLTIPRGATTGQRLRLRGRGIKGGDQHVELKIVMPPAIDEDLARFMEEWRKDHAYDPRKGGAS